MKLFKAFKNAIIFLFVIFDLEQVWNIL